MVSVMSWSPYPLLKGWKWKAGWGSRLIWRVEQNLFPIWFRIQDRPDSSQSLYRLSFTGPWKSISGKPRRRLNDVLSYLSVVYLLYRLYFKMSCVYCCSCLVCIVVSSLVCIVVSCLVCIVVVLCIVVSSLVCIVVVVLCALLSSYVYLL